MGIVAKRSSNLTQSDAGSEVMSVTDYCSIDQWSLFRAAMKKKNSLYNIPPANKSPLEAEWIDEVEEPRTLTWSAEGCLEDDDGKTSPIDGIKPPAARDEDGGLQLDLLAYEEPVFPLYGAVSPNSTQTRSDHTIEDPTFQYEAIGRSDGAKEDDYLKPCQARCDAEGYLEPAQLRLENEYATPYLAEKKDGTDIDSSITYALPSKKSASILGKCNDTDVPPFLVRKREGNDIDPGLTYALPSTEQSVSSLGEGNDSDVPSMLSDKPHPVYAKPDMARRKSLAKCHSEPTHVQANGDTGESQDVDDSKG